MKRRLKQRIDLQQNTVSVAADGEPVASWSTYRRCAASIEDSGGREVFFGAGQDAIVDARITLRYPREGRIPTTEDRIVYDENGTKTTRTLNIERVQRLDESRRWLRLFCREDVS